jgi:hypothetical protein
MACQNLRLWLVGKFACFEAAHASINGDLLHMEYEERFTDAELGKVIEQAMIYMCACPAQVADAIRKLRALYRYQLQCIQVPESNPAVHTLIAQSTIHSHSIMQDCMEKIIELEEWDRTTLEMPAGLRIRQLQELLSDDPGDQGLS